jgi:GDP-4-dehydro-6-deoxy-D-mannose reductase
VPAGLDVEWRPLELLEAGAIEALLADVRPEGIVHLAGFANVAAAAAEPIEAYRVNAEGTVRLLAAQRDLDSPPPTVVVTSAEVYGAVKPEDLPVGEDCPLAPRTAYGVSKAAADFAAEQAARVWGLPVVRMRPFNHIGPGQARGFVAPDFASQVAAIERGEAEPVLRVGNLSARRDFTDVRDVARGYRMALDAPAPGEVFNLCSGRSIEIEEIVRFFLDRSTRPIEIRRDETRMRAADVPEFRGDAGRARARLGWEPRIAIERSLAEVMDEWRARSAESAAD